MNRSGNGRLCALAMLTIGQACTAQVLFSDAFEGGPSPLWRNERGAWTTSGGVYYATQPSNVPPTLTTVPYTLGDFDLDLDINQVSDGGIFLHVDAGAQNGVLLVTGGNLHTGRGFYWHIISNGSYSSQMNPSAALFNQLDNIHVRVSARGPTYAAYINGSATPASTLTLPGARTGSVGLYDFSAFPVQTFDNVVLGVPCYANCDGSTTAPVLNVNDFVCFQTRFAAGDPFANCDASTAPPVLNINDFVCFQQRFASGCQ